MIQQWADANGHEVIGWAEDVDLPGSVDPFQAPAVGPWLNERAPEFDVIAVWKLDRLSRSTISLNKLIGWCMDHDKIVVSASEGIDLSTPVGRLIANVIGFLAEGELEAIRERVKGSRRKLRELGRWPGGKPPFGYKAIPRDGGGWRLVIDREAAWVVRRVVDDLLDGKPLTRIARELTSEGVPTPARYYALLRGSWRESQGAGAWGTTPIRNMLRSPMLRGFAHHNGQIVRDDQSMPVQLAEPLVTLDEWELIQAALDRTQEARKDARRTEASPLSGLVFCAGFRHNPDCPNRENPAAFCDDCPRCEEPLHHDLNTVRRAAKTYEYRYYRCRSREHTMIPAEELEEMAEEDFLRELGDQEVRERVWVPGDTNEQALREAVTAFDELSKAAGRAVSATAKQRLQAQLDALDARIAELESAPTQEARWEYRATGGTYREVWEAADTAACRELLLKSGITFTARVVGGRGSNAREFQTRIPEELERRMGIPPRPPRVPEPPERYGTVGAGLFSHGEG
ncbi:integrase [Mycobacterium heckeshornense]|uniref:Integrase n=1 Tax=Mycobacterium heckeshornense TaxID=110505 RepID=A0A7R7GX39_9MYCO|nr:integrase [Mycobacterium heckeshornense]